MKGIMISNLDQQFWIWIWDINTRFSLQPKKPLRYHYFF